MRNNVYKWVVIWVCCILTAACSQKATNEPSTPSVQYAPTEIQTDRTIITAEEGMIPTHIEIPAIDVSAVVEKVGLEEDGQMSVPDSGSVVGWYSKGYRPGKKGNAVLAGHVDDKNAPAVFFYLKNLKVGDTVYLHGDHNQMLTFTVKEIKAYPYDKAPLEEIFGRHEKARLNLITCTGQFDRNTGNHAERLVVFTELQTPSPKSTP